MTIPSITDIVALIGILVMLWKTFFSKSDKKKLQVEVDKIEAENDKTAAETADKYEDALDKQLTRISRLENIIALYDKKFLDQEKRFYDQEIRIAKLEKENKKLVRKLDDRDSTIDCLEVYYRELAQKACAGGIEGIVTDPPCFKTDDEE